MQHGYKLNLIALCALALATAAVACKKERPPNHPVSDVKARAGSKIELVAIVVEDPERAKLVKGSYVAINELSAGLVSKRATHLKRIAELTDSYVISEDEVRTEVAALRQVGRDAYNEYVVHQLDIRKNTTADEYAKLEMK